MSCFSVALVKYQDEKNFRKKCLSRLAIPEGDEPMTVGTGAEQKAERCIFGCEHEAEKNWN